MARNALSLEISMQWNSSRWKVARRGLGASLALWAWLTGASTALGDEHFLLVRTADAADDRVHLDVRFAPADVQVNLVAFLGPGPHDARDGRVVASGSTDASGGGQWELPVRILGLDAWEAARESLSIRAFALDPSGAEIQSNAVLLTPPASLYLLVEAFDGSSSSRLVRCNPTRREALSLVQGIGSHRDAGPTRRVAAHGPSGSVVYEAPEAPSALRRAFDRSREGLVDFAGRSILDVAFTQEASQLLVLTSRAGEDGRRQLQLSAIPVDAFGRRTDLQSTGAILSTRSDAWDAWLAIDPGDDRRAFVVVRSDGMDRVQQWLLGSSLVEAPTLAPTHRFTQELVDIRVAGPFLAAAVNDDEVGASIVVFDVVHGTKLCEVPLGTSVHTLRIQEAEHGVVVWTVGGTEGAVVTGLTLGHDGAVRGLRRHIVPEARDPVLLPEWGALYLVGDLEGEPALYRVGLDDGTAAPILPAVGQVRGLGGLRGSDRTWLFGFVPDASGMRERLVWWELGGDGTFLRPAVDVPLGGHCTRVVPTSSIVR